MPSSQGFEHFWNRVACEWCTNSRRGSYKRNSGLECDSRKNSETPAASHPKAAAPSSSNRRKSPSPLGSPIVDVEGIHASPRDDRSLERRSFQTKKAPHDLTQPTLGPSKVCDPCVCPAAYAWRSLARDCTAFRPPSLRAPISDPTYHPPNGAAG